MSRGYLSPGLPAVISAPGSCSRQVAHHDAPPSHLVPKPPSCLQHIFTHSSSGILIRGFTIILSLFFAFCSEKLAKKNAHTTRPGSPIEVFTACEAPRVGFAHWAGLTTLPAEVGLWAHPALRASGLPHEIAFGSAAPSREAQYPKLYSLKKAN